VWRQAGRDRRPTGVRPAGRVAAADRHPGPRSGQDGHRRSGGRSLLRKPSRRGRLEDPRREAVASPVGCHRARRRAGDVAECRDGFAHPRAGRLGDRAPVVQDRRDCSRRHACLPGDIRHLGARCTRAVGRAVVAVDVPETERPHTVRRVRLRHIEPPCRPEHRKRARCTTSPTRAPARVIAQRWNSSAADEAASAHRNWTGRGIYQASFVPVQEGDWRIGSVATGAELSRRRSPEHDCLMLEPVLVAIVLGEPAVHYGLGCARWPETTKARRRTPCHY